MFMARETLDTTGQGPAEAGTSEGHTGQRQVRGTRARDPRFTPPGRRVPGLPPALAVFHLSPCMVSSCISKVTTGRQDRSLKLPAFGPRAQAEAVL